MVMMNRNVKLSRLRIKNEAPTQQKHGNSTIFQHIAHRLYANLQIFAKNRLSRNHAAAVALRDRFYFNYFCHRRTLCPTLSKWLSLWLQLQFQHVHNKKKQRHLSLTLLQKHLLVSTKNSAGRGFGLAYAPLSLSDQRRVS